MRREHGDFTRSVNVISSSPSSSSLFPFNGIEEGLGSLERREITSCKCSLKRQQERFGCFQRWCYSELTEVEVFLPLHSDSDRPLVGDGDGKRKVDRERAKRREREERREEENTEEVISIWLDENERVTWSARTANIDWVRPLMGFVDQRTYRSRTGRSWLLIVKVRVDVWQRSIGLNGSSTLMTGIHDGGDIAAMSPSFLAQRGPTNSKSDAILYYLYHPFLSQQPMELQCKSLFVHTELRREMPSEKHRQLSESSSKRSSLVFGLTFGRAVCSSDKCVDVVRMNASSMSPSTIS